MAGFTPGETGPGHGWLIVLLAILVQLDSGRFEHLCRADLRRPAHGRQMLAHQPGLLAGALFGSA